MTIRAKLYAAIALTILGPLLTTVVAIEGRRRWATASTRSGQRADDAALAQEIKFDVTDMNGWQTAYGYAGDGRFRSEFVAARDRLDGNLTTAEEELTERREQDLIAQLRTQFDQFLALDGVAFRALQAGRRRGGEADLPRPRAACASRRWPRPPRNWPTTRRIARPRPTTAFDDDRDQARKRLIAVALGAALVIVLLLVTAQDVVRLALEGARSREDGTRAEGDADGSS